MVPMYMTSCLGLVVEYHVCVSVAMEVKKIFMHNVVSGVCTNYKCT